ncbi:hypothetical protein ACTXT7_000324 [Hymenolepis weldensis]
MAWLDGRKSWEVNAPHLVKDLQVSEGTTRYKECCSSRPRRKRSVFGFPPTKNTSTKMKKLIKVMIGGENVLADPIKIAFVMDTKFPTTVMVLDRDLPSSLPCLIIFLHISRFHFNKAPPAISCLHNSRCHPSLTNLKIASKTRFGLEGECEIGIIGS